MMYFASFQAMLGFGVAGLALVLNKQAFRLVIEWELHLLLLLGYFSFEVVADSRWPMEGKAHGVLITQQIFC